MKAAARVAPARSSGYELLGTGFIGIAGLLAYPMFVEHTGLVHDFIGGTLFTLFGGMDGLVPGGLGLFGLILIGNQSAARIVPRMVPAVVFASFLL